MFSQRACLYFDSSEMNIKEKIKQQKIFDMLLVGKESEANIKVIKCRKESGKC